jgi:hypothetical protein
VRNAFEHYVARRSGCRDTQRSEVIVNVRWDAAKKKGLYVVDDKTYLETGELTKAISADANWASAEAMLDLANQGRDVARIAPAQALQSAAMSNAMSVGSGLPADAAAKRAAAAQEAANKAAQDALSNSKDTLKQATSRAWQKVAQAVASGGGSSGGPLAHFGGKGGGGNWLTKQFGPMKTWQWGLTGVGVVVGAIVVVKLLRR